MTDTVTGRELWQYKQRTHRSWLEVGAAFGLSESEARERGRKAANEGPQVQRYPINKYRSTYPPSDADSGHFSSHDDNFPEALNGDLEEPIQVADPNILILGDLHCPYHNVKMLQRALYIRDNYFPQIRQIGIGGDTFDFPSIGKHPQTGVAADPNQTIDTAGRVLHRLLSDFDRAYFVSGNHDERVAKKLDQPFHLKYLIGAALHGRPLDCEVEVSNLDYFYIGDTWLVGHPSNYSSRGGETPCKLAEKYRRNVITFHNHQVGWAFSDSGYIGVDTGCMTEENRHYYLVRRLNKFPKWQPGFTFIVDGYHYLFAENSADWQFYGCE